MTFQTPSERAVRRWGAFRINGYNIEFIVSNPFRAGGEALNDEVAALEAAEPSFQTPSERAVRRCTHADDRPDRPTHRFKPLQSGR